MLGLEPMVQSGYEPCFFGTARDSGDCLEALGAYVGGSLVERGSYPLHDTKVDSMVPWYGALIRNHSKHIETQSFQQLQDKGPCFKSLKKSKGPYKGLVGNP